MGMWCGGPAMMNEFEGCVDEYRFIPLDSLIVQKQKIWNLYPFRIDMCEWDSEACDEWEIMKSE